MVEKKCSECGGTKFRVAHDEWMKRTFIFVENGTLDMCDGCGAKFLICSECGGHYTRVHPALETWEVPAVCPSCGHVNADVKAWSSGQYKYDT